MAAILIAEDEERIALFIEKGLRAEGHAPTVARDGKTALRLALSGQFDLMLLDIGLPIMDGFAVLEAVRGQGSRLPVIILTARDTVTDTVSGLESGADDYMPKPFRFEELVARIKIRIRDATPVTDTTLSAGDLSLDLRTRIAVANERKVELSAREFALLEMFLRNRGQVLTREQLLSRVWGYNFDPGSNVVDVYVRYLRNKIGSARITTVRGAGYRLD